MEQSFVDQAAASTSPQIFSPPFSSGQVLLRLATQQHPPRPSALPNLSALLNPTTMSHAALGSAVRFQTNSSLSPDPPASGPSVASMPATTRLRNAVTAAAAAQNAQAARRNSRSRRGAGLTAPPPTRSAFPVASVAAAAAAAPTPASPEVAEAPRRSARNRKRAPAATAAETSRDPPAKKQKRGNLKSPPPGSAKSDDSKPSENERTASCCICMDEPKPADLASINGCDHLFCFECIEKWAERENTCPLCKVRFTKIDRVNKSKKKKGEAAKNTKKVKQKDQRSDIATGAALEGLLASFASSASFPHQRVARLIFSGIGASGSNPFAVLPGAVARRAAAGSDRTTSIEDSLLSSDTDDDDEVSFLPPGAASFADFFRAVPRGPGIYVSTGLAGRHGLSMTLDPPPGRSYASNSNDRTAGRQAENPLEIEDDSEDEDDIEVVQVTRSV